MWKIMRTGRLFLYYLKARLSLSSSIYLNIQRKEKVRISLLVV